jgi:hypothetical protein
MLSPSYGPPFDDPADLGSPVLEPVWIEPLPDPAEAYERRETVALLGAINALTVRDSLICEITGFLDPALHSFLGVPLEFPESSAARR